MVEKESARITLSLLSLQWPQERGLSPFDRWGNRLREGKWLLLGHPERKWAQSHLFKSKVLSVRPSCLLWGDSKPGRERHTYLIPSCSGLHLPTLWDHHRQLRLIVGACGNILRQKAQWRFRHSPNIYWCLPAPVLRTEGSETDMTTVHVLTDR